MFIVSDMLQNSDNWSHYYQGTSWNNFSNEMKGTVFMRTRLNKVKVQIFYAIRQNDRDRSIQTNSHAAFWEQFFENANAELTKPWLLIDG